VNGSARSHFVKEWLHTTDLTTSQYLCYCFKSVIEILLNAGDSCNSSIGVSIVFALLLGVRHAVYSPFASRLRSLYTDGAMEPFLTSS
jgi:hypothetical protein